MADTAPGIVFLELRPEIGGRTAPRVWPRLGATRELGTLLDWAKTTYGPALVAVRAAAASAYALPLKPSAMEAWTAARAVVIAPPCSTTLVSPLAPSP